jgi:hypothetical protein
MFHILKLVAQVLLSPHHIVDKASCRTFLIELVLLVKTFAAKTETKLDDVLLKHVDIILNNDALFDYVYQLIAAQLQTDEILFESADEGTIVGLVENAATAESPESIDPVVVISLITQIISFMNRIKNR